MSKISITTIILTYNEELHIRRCLENALRFSERVYVIDSPSTDRTSEICKEFDNVELVVHKYPGNQAEQFNWALDNLNITSEWILRLDADEYLSDALIEEIEETIPNLSDNITGCMMKRDVIFMNKRIRHGKVKSLQLLRLWRTGKARIENRLMDEHTILSSGETVLLKNYFFDHNINGIDAWVRKHLDYSNREIQTLKDSSINNKRKGLYYSLPSFHRGFWFFCFRYFLLGGFLDGKAGFVWNFMQCWWYRTLVDTKITNQNKR